ncbi:Ldh family oxidoreductase [Alcaligenes sp. SDU_A2]|uniref:Ldh family oxidoreductase n=1 Tax=Alcaligenes sp. SDU_A2 TaxID=3136634 RepID=UPI00311F7E56
MSAIFINYASLRDWCAAMLQTAGVAPEAAAVAASYMLRTDARGIRTHGITRLASYLDKLASGEVNAGPDVRVHQDTAGLTVQADGALGQYAMHSALEHGLARLREQAMVAVRIQACGHLGALGIYALEAAEQGAFCLLAQRTPPLMGMPGFNAPVIGNNPFAYASPVAGGAPLVFDMACSVAARGHILLKARQQEPIPSGWALDEQGEPTTNADEALRGSLLPSAMHKGMGLAMLVECLAGAMAASPDSLAALEQPASIPTAGAMGRQSALMLLINPQTLSQGLFGDYMASWSRHYRSRGGDSARLPGERGAQLEAQVQTSGLLPLHPSLCAELMGLGQARDLPLPACESVV